ncbi:MAG: type IX secretion system membrane protein PorP/SprF [Hyphomicrobiales bacterium]
MLKTRKLFIVLSVFLFGLVSKEVTAQDPSFSQFYSNPLYLNPAFAGAGDECGRMVLNYRNQWPEINKGFVTYSISYDQSLDAIKSGYGISVMADNAGQGSLNKTFVNGLYSYMVDLDYNWKLRLGLQATYIQRKLDWNKLIFSDQVDPITGETRPYTNEIQPENLSKNVFDFSAGGVLYYSDQLSLGVSVYHIGAPDVSFYSTSKEESSRLNRKYTVHGTFNVNLTVGRLGDIQEGDFILYPSFLYQQQGDYKQLNIGTYLSHDFITLGSWFRYTFEQKAEAVIFSVGIQYNGMRFGYSYDYTLSNLGATSGGAHEISFAADFCLFTDPSRRTIHSIKSPKF